MVLANESQDGLGHDLGRTSISPEPSSALDICDGGRHNVIEYSETNAFLKEPFPILSTVSITTVWAIPLQGDRVHNRALGLGLGSEQETSKHKSTTKYKDHVVYRT